MSIDILSFYLVFYRTSYVSVVLMIFDIINFFFEFSFGISREIGTDYPLGSNSDGDGVFLFWLPISLVKSMSAYTINSICCL